VFGPGTQELAVSSDVAQRSFTFLVPAGQDQTSFWIVIQEDGRVDRSTADLFPASPLCGT
jgi:hypothetical protein